MATTKYKQTIKGSKDAAKTFQRQAELLRQQIKARQRSRTGLVNQYRNARLRNDSLRKSRVTDVLGGFNTALEGYNRSEKDATANLGATVGESRLNRAREGTSAMAELSNMQAGETDRIKGMAASIRALKINVDQGVSDYANAVTSINNSLGDLNTSTRTNINNELREQNSNNAQAFAELSAGQQQAYADLVDLYGQMGSAHEEAAMALADKKSSTTSSGTTSIKSTQKDSIKQNKRSRREIDLAKQSFKGSAQNANYLADQMGKTFTDQIQTIEQMNAKEANPLKRFNAAAMKQNQSNLDELENRATLKKLAAPEGSKLRKKVLA